MLNFDPVLQALRRDFPQAEVRLQEPMRAHTSFRIGGPAAAMFLPKTIEELQRICTLLREAGIRPLIVGNGTNLLVSDTPKDLVAVKTCGCLMKIEVDGNVITAESGALLSKIASAALEHGLAGFAFAHGIPGTLGGAVVMNAGAYGGEIKDVLLWAEALDETGVLRRYDADACRFGYRFSRFSESRETIVRAAIGLTPGDRGEIRREMDDLAERRRASQPLNQPSAGSTFKRPAVGYAAALIDQAGLKGKGVGGARVSEKHAGFVVSDGAATFDDVLATMELVRTTVRRVSGVELEPEIKIIY